MKKMSPPIRFHDCLSNSAGFLQVRTVFLFSLGVGGVLLIFDSFGSSVVQPLIYTCRMYVVSSLDAAVMPGARRVRSILLSRKSNVKYTYS